MKRNFASAILVILSTAVIYIKADNYLNSPDRAIIATCMVLEAGCDGGEGMQAVLNVILNRAESRPERVVREVVKYKAFSCMEPIWKKRKPDYGPLIRRAMSQTDAYEEAMRLIDEMDNGLLWDNTFGANHYHATWMEPYWADGMQYLVTVGGHHFYTDRPVRIASL